MADLLNRDLPAPARYALASLEVLEEIDRAKTKHPGDFRSAHEGFAVLYEEFDELKAEVWKSTHDKTRMREEAIQVAAMAIRFAVELT
jgi:hypothetical protein